MIRRHRGRVLGVILTVLVIVGLLVSQNYEKDTGSQKTKGDQSALASHDPTELSLLKKKLQDEVAAVVPVVFDRMAGMSAQDYLTSASPYVTTKYLDDFKNLLYSSPEVSLRAEGSSIISEIIVEPEGPITKMGEEYFFEGILTLNRKEVSSAHVVQRLGTRKYQVTFIYQQNRWLLSDVIPAYA